MAKLKFVAKAIDEREFELCDIKSYELNRDIDAACDGLRITVITNAPLEELVSIKAYNGDELIFNGYVDSQRDSLNKNGMECFIYARSSACVLLDNEAEPKGYNCPTAESLFVCNASEFGFKSKLPMLSTGHSYVVNKGVSCFGAINNFVSAITGKGIIVNPFDELIVPSSNGVLDVEKLNIISEKRIINRGGLLSRVDYKIDGDNSYAHHIKSRFLEARGVTASKKINLTTLPVWQREYVARDTISKCSNNYYAIELVADGSVSPELYDAAVGSSALGSLDGYYVTGVCIMLDSNGERTKLELCKNFDLEEITYVVE